MQQLLRLAPVLTTVLITVLLAACASSPGTPILDNAKVRDELVQTAPREWRLTAFGAEVHSADQVSRAFAARAAKVCASGTPTWTAPKSEPYQYDTGKDSATVAHNAFKATGTITCKE
jgi:alpha-ketoglutarate-dependent taurine dioxygenase